MQYIIEAWDVSQKITAADPLMHYIYCGSKFVTPTGDGIVQVQAEPESMSPPPG